DQTLCVFSHLMFHNNSLLSLFLAF
ncbi:hypothetical protein HZ326_9286, partial [Fusarium oxysporum f. sp. albedinis]